MTERKLDDRAIEAAFLARAAGSPSDDLERRIANGVRSTRQRRPLLGFLAAVSPAGRGLAWVAVLTAATLVLLGTLALASGWQPSLLSLVPTPSPKPSATLPPGSPAPSSQPSGPVASPPGPRTVQARFTTSDGVAVTIDIVDQSGQLLEAVQGEEGLPTEPSDADVQFANLPGKADQVRVEWFSPGGCHAQYGMTIDAGLRTITMRTTYVEGGDALGGNCGITLRFATAVVASQLQGVRQNTSPGFGVGSLPVNGVARVVATDGLRVRSAPGTGADSARLEPLLPAGVRLLVLEGSVSADGYAWYRVRPCDGQPAYPSGWVAVVSREAEAWVEAAPGESCVATPPTALPSLGEVPGPTCDGGGITGSDIERVASPTIAVVDALNQDFAGILPTDQVALATHEGRPAVAVIRAGKVVLIGDYGQDGHVHQYQACGAAGFKVRGSA